LKQAGRLRSPVRCKRNETTPELLANLEHEFRISRNPVRLGIAAGQHERHLHQAWASPDSIPILWLAGPITGLLVQPVIGAMSDRTWNKLGRRKPYFLTGAILASIALILMPDSPALLYAAALLWILDASIT